jgi:hypothetical protein
MKIPAAAITVIAARHSKLRVDEVTRLHELLSDAHPVDDTAWNVGAATFGTLIQLSGWPSVT